MIRSELLTALAQDNPELRAEEVEQVVDIFFEEIAQRLAEGGRVELRGFFKIRLNFYSIFAVFFIYWFNTT